MHQNQQQAQHHYNLMNQRGSFMDAQSREPNSSQNQSPTERRNLRQYNNDEYGQ